MAHIIIASLQLAANLPALQNKGWMPVDTAAFAAVRGTFPTSTTTQQSAKGDAMDSTTTKNSDANTLYDNLLAIQNAADLQWPVEDPANAGIRAQFRLNVFPPTSSGGEATPQPPEPAAK